MLGVLFLLICLFSFYNGARRGVALQLIHLVGFSISFMIALSKYKDFGKHIELYVPYMSVTPDSSFAFYSMEQGFELGHAYYAAVAFFGLLFFGWLITKFIAIFFLRLREFTLLNRYDWIVSGILNVLMIYVLFFGLLYILSFVPLAFIQQWFAKGELGYGIVKHTPILSKWFYQLLITNII
ncbi:CvpA family protein [Enterococcus bulliens]